MSIADKLSEYIHSVKYNDLSEKTIHEAKRRIIDALGCAIGAFNAEPVKIVREIAKNVNSKGSATIFGTKYKTSVEWATFVNGTMVRYLDFMDTYFPLGDFVHPQDNIAPILAVAESERLSGKDVLLATILAYEACCRFVDWTNIRKRGWDHVIWITISSTLAVSKLLKLPPEKIVEAVSIAISSNIPLRQIRVGKLSMWKGLAVAYATKAAVFASYLAKQGITGPTEIFEGKHGFFNQITGKSDFSVENFARNSGFKILDVTIKKYPVESNALSAVEAAFEVRRKLRSILDIDKINIYTYTTAYQIIADKEKWNPTNRETADHSLPYIVCAALVDGEMTEKQFSDKRIFDSALRKLLNKTSVQVAEEYDKHSWPAAPNKVEVITKSGGKIFAEIIYPKGSFKYPMSDKEMEEKFKGLVKKFIRQGQIENGLKTLWDLEKQKNISKIISYFLVKK